MEKKLPIIIPPIIGYTIHAYPLAMILHSNDCLPWFHSNYIQLVCNPNFEETFFDFSTLCSIIYDDIWIDSIYPGIPWINRNSIEEYVIVDLHLKVGEVIKSALINDNYVITSIDEYNIPSSKNYQIKHTYHETLIYGFDDNTKSFDILAYNTQGLFSKEKINFEDLQNSFDDFVSKNYYNAKLTETYYNPIKFLKLNQNYRYNFDLKFVRDSLINYLDANNIYQMLSSIRNINSNLVYGIKVYDELKRYLRLVDKEGREADLRPTRILLEHKKCMVMRLSYIKQLYSLKEFDVILNLYKDIEKECLKLHNLLIKYTITKQSIILDQMISHLENIHREEKDTIIRLINVIDTLI